MTKIRQWLNQMRDSKLSRMVKLTCYHCGSHQLSRNGLIQNAKQRYLCSECRPTSRHNPQPNGYSEEEREEVRMNSGSQGWQKIFD
jgi:transposase-like protein